MVSRLRYDKSPRRQQRLASDSETNPPPASTPAATQISTCSKGKMMPVDFPVRQALDAADRNS